MALAGKRVLVTGGSGFLGRHMVEPLTREAAEYSRLFDLFHHHPELEVLPVPKRSVDRRCPDRGKLEALTGYRSNVPLDVGVKDTFAWYRREASQSNARSPSLASY